MLDLQTLLQLTAAFVLPFFMPSSKPLTRQRFLLLKLTYSFFEPVDF